MSSSAKTAIYRLGVTADLHCGSRYGIVPPKFRPLNAGPSAVFMDYIWDIWQDYVKRCPPLDALILCGDALEGETPKQSAPMDAIVESPHQQVDMAIEAIGPLREKARKFWLLRGTPFHDSKHNEPIEMLGKELSAERWGGRRYSGYVLEGDWHGVKLQATHHASFGGAIYGGTLADRTTLFQAAAEREGKLSNADLLIRAHTHRTYKGESHGKWILLCRCWKLVTPHALQKLELTRATLLSDLGAHLVTTTGRGDILWEPDFAYEAYKTFSRSIA